MGFDTAKTRFRGKTAYRMMAASCAMVCSCPVRINILAIV
jgi:hypothetical protein